MRQALQIVQGGTAPTVDGLVVVAHSGKPGPLTHQELQHLVLGGVGVLVFIHQHMAHLLLPQLAHVGVLLQEFERQADQIVKVHALVGAQAFFVARHDACGDALVVVAGLGLGHGGVEALVFPQADGPLPLASGGRVGGAARVFQYGGHVVGVQNAEIVFQSQRLAVLPQHAHTQGVEGAN